MLYSDTYCVEEHQNNDEPIEPLCLHCVSDPKSKPLFGTPEVRAFADRSRFAFQETCSNQKHLFMFHFIDTTFCNRGNAVKNVMPSEGKGQAKRGRSPS